MIDTPVWVMNENALVYGPKGHPRVGVLQGDLLNGGPNWRDGPVLADWSNTRAATLADFQRFRVSPTYHLTHAAVWYDHGTRLWVLQWLDAEGNQLGDAIYEAHKARLVQDARATGLPVYIGTRAAPPGLPNDPA